MFLVFHEYGSGAAMLPEQPFVPLLQDAYRRKFATRRQNRKIGVKGQRDQAS